MKEMEEMEEMNEMNGMEEMEEMELQSTGSFSRVGCSFVVVRLPVQPACGGCSLVSRQVGDVL